MFFTKAQYRHSLNEVLFTRKKALVLFLLTLFLCLVINSGFYAFAKFRYEVATEQSANRVVDFFASFSPVRQKDSTFNLDDAIYEKDSAYIYMDLNHVTLYKGDESIPYLKAEFKKVKAQYLKVDDNLSLIRFVSDTNSR